MRDMYAHVRGIRRGGLRFLKAAVLWGVSSLHSTPASGQDAGVPLETTVFDERQMVPEERASTVVHQADFERRLPRSAPEALRFEPGVFIQQTAHGQASVFLRGLTGQQTVLLFDGIRLNTSTWRQGPNQYFFTLDANSIESLEVLRGGSATRFGSDAMGGAIVALPIEAPAAEGGWRVLPSLAFKAATADSQVAARLGLRGWVGPVAFVGGVGLRQVGLLESAGSVRSLRDGSLPEVPRFEEDGRTQLGTGFNELTADGRLTWRTSGNQELTLASNAYRQFDAPRTDQCPPASARSDECLTYAHQFRSLSWAAWKGRFTEVELARATVSWQQQHELREGRRPSSFVLNTGADTVDTFGASLMLQSRRFVPLANLSLQLTAGADAYLDWVQSRSFVSFTDVAVTRELSRGQYLSGSSSLTGGAFVDAEAGLGTRLTLRGGSRLGVAALSSPADTASGTAEARGTWTPLAAHVGAQWQPAGPVELLVNFDRSFRTPNLDDLTSRQQTGPGFQVENPTLRPEGATSIEAGGRLHGAWVSLEAWLFQTWLEDAMVKEPIDVAQCPAATPQCGSAWYRYQLRNATGLSEVRGLEAWVRFRLPMGLGGRATAAYAWGQGPSPRDGGGGLPLSRIPPAHGTVELSWRHRVGVAATTALRWAGPQTRLAVADFSDPRIPLGGTPGYAVVDLRASLRMSPLVVTLVIENLFDSPWRAHGSAINGPGRGLMMLVSFRAPDGGEQADRSQPEAP